MYLYLLNLTALLWMTEIKFPGAPSLSLDASVMERMKYVQSKWAGPLTITCSCPSEQASVPSPSLPVPVDPLCSDPKPVPWGWPLATWRTSCLRCSLCSELFTSPINIQCAVLSPFLNWPLSRDFLQPKPHFLASSMAKLPLRPGGALSPRLPFSLAPAPNRPWSPLHCYPFRHSHQTLSPGPQHGRQSCHCPP